MAEEGLLTDLCSICHTKPPKYRCPRCSIRTCSLPCTRRHKLWSQCSGVRDPAAYLRRSELATESAFDRDFNFITGIERGIERAEREADRRGVDISVAGNYKDLEVVGLDQGGDDDDDEKDINQGAGNRSRKRPLPDDIAVAASGRSGPGPVAGLAKGEAAFLRRAQSAGVRVIKAPRGMSRNKGNASKWHQRNKCVYWTVEWIMEDGEKRLRNCPETCSIAEAFDRAFPLSKEERGNCKDDEDKGYRKSEDEKEELLQTPVSQEETLTGKSVSQSCEKIVVDGHPVSSQARTIASKDLSVQQEATLTSTEPITSHRNVYFYLHRPRTTTKQPVLIPLSPDTNLNTALNGRTVLEFPTIYVLRSLLDEYNENSRFVLETSYLRTHEEDLDTNQLPIGDMETHSFQGPVDIENIDEGKVLEVLQKDLSATNADSAMM